jgi:hypothetical protein
MPTLSVFSAAAVAFLGATALTLGAHNASTESHPSLSVVQPSITAAQPLAHTADDRQHQLDARRAGLSFKDADGLQAAVQAASVDAARGEPSAVDLLVLVAATQCSSPFVADHWLCEAGK